MSTLISRLYGFVTDKANGVKITASKVDGELDQDIVALNRKVLCSGSAPSAPIAGQTWVDTTNKLLKMYRNNEWVIQGIVHVGTSAPTTPQTGDLWFDTTAKLLSSYNGSGWVSTLSTATNFRSQLYLIQSTTTALIVAPGALEINGAIVSKTANVTLTLTTDADWAGGASQQATNTTGYVVIDASGNIKLSTTAPTHANYALSINAANNTKRYATISATVYRYLGWFRMNGTGSGQLDAYGVSNLADGAIKNVVEFETGAVATGTTVIPADDTIPQNTEGDQYMSLNFVPTNINNKLKIDVVFQGASSNNSTTFVVGLFQDSTANALAIAADSSIPTSSVPFMINFSHYMKAGTISLTTFKVRAGNSGAGTTTFNGAAGSRQYGGVMASSIRIEEIESQLA